MVDAPLPAALGGPSHTNTALSATKLDGSGTGKLYPRQAPANTSLVVNTSPTAAAKGREGRSTSPGTFLAPPSRRLVVAVPI